LFSELSEPIRVVCIHLDIAYEGCLSSYCLHVCQVTVGSAAGSRSVKFKTYSKFCRLEKREGAFPRTEILGRLACRLWCGVVREHSCCRSCRLLAACSRLFQSRWTQEVLTRRPQSSARMVTPLSPQLCSIHHTNTIFSVHFP